ncbi:Signal transduction histidine kinase [Nocardiopsis flavescens]|uniref:histidine kinase n=1 Tax=Nocardiopsis flavescens TaxID=758803 RepID=A0A1M6CTD0_9ACTN|nr:histidine kinase [Nocardiopsis flavescens]SHI64277.1 Signal transduction histidine kinase [Nocardiopsis flavescens]
MEPKTLPLLGPRRGADGPAVPGPGFPGAVAGGPLRVPLTLWPLRSLLYLATSLPVAVVWAAVCWPLGLLAGVPLGAVERRRLALVDRAAAPSPHGPASAPVPSARWIRLRAREAATWRELAYGLLLLPLALLEAVAVVLLVSLPLTLLLSPLLRATGGLDARESSLTAGARLFPALPWAADMALGALALVAAAYLVTALAVGRARLARVMLAADREEELGERLGEAVRSRTRLADAFTAERRRIERDLHDGAQQRLTVLTLRLGMARTRFDADPEQARELVEQAYEEARGALAELRELVHGIHPAALTERGLVGALEELADSCPVPVVLDAGETGRLPGAVESTAYFCAREALGNAVRHSGAGEIRLSVRVSRAGSLVLRVVDDGVGGADPGRGSGLAGLADRAGAYLGTVRLSSPAGGPTSVEVEIPCAS